MTRRILGVCVLLAVVTLPAVTTRIYASDEVQYFAFLRSLAFDGDLSFENEYQHFYDAGAGGPGFHDTFLAERFTAAGRRINFGTIGPALLWAPFYGVGHVVAGLTGAPQDGYSAPYISAVAYGSAIYGWLAIALSALIAQRLVGRGLAPALAIVAGSPLLFYMYVAPPFSHACATFAVALFLWVWLRVRDRWSLGGVVALGLTGGLMGTMRDQTVLFLIPPAIDFLRTSLRPEVRRRLPAGALAQAGLALLGTLATLVAYSPHLLAQHAINGYVGPHESVGNKMSWSSPHFFEVLVSPWHGWLVWTPLAVLALAGLVALATGRTRAQSRDAAWIGLCALLMVLLQVYINGAVESWTVAGAFGQRRFVELTPLLVLGLAAVLTTDLQPRRLTWVVILICVWWNLGLLLQFGTHRMNRQRLTLSDNARVTFIELPLEAPSLVWRYFTNRDSFYRQPRQ